MSRNRHSRRETALRFMILLAAAAILVTGFYYAGRWLEKRAYREERQQMSADFGLLPVRSYQGQDYLRRPEVTTLLLMGIDRHAEQEPSGYRGGGQADFLMLLALDHQNKTVRQLQIDRDSMTDVPVVGVLGNDVGTRYMQVCLAHGYGRDEEARCRHAVQAVSNLLSGEEIPLYLAVRLDAVAALNSALGGITVTLPEDYSSLDPTMTKGAVVTLTDSQAEILVRARRTVGDGTNAARMLRQRVFLSAAADAMWSRLSEDGEFAGRIFDALGEISSHTNIQRGWLINEVNLASGYDILPVETLTGEYKIGEDGFMQFHADQDAIAAWLLSALYEPKK